jgi:glycosyltransferase involved in cell wall biosynthesis
VGIHWFNGSNISVGYENLIDQGKFPKGGSIYPYVQKYLNVFTVSNTNNIIINNITTSYKNHLLANYKVLYKVKNILETMDKNYFDLTLINGKVIDNDTISIVMTACNRSKQTYYTLSTINNSSYKNIQIILVDDSTHDPILIRKLQEYNMHIELINIKNKFWVNPCVNYNIGLKHARGGKVIIQNAEVCYVKGDILSYVAHNVKNNEYHSFNIYALDNIEQNNLLYEDNTNPETRLKGMWYQHPAHRNAYYHFLVAMTIDTFKKVGGFDIDYSIGVDFDDNGLVHRVRGSGIKLVNVGESFMGVHLWHAQSSCGSQSSNVSNQHLFMVKHNYYDKYKIFLDLTLFPEDVVVHIINSMF